jgi:hypothetical protein
MAMQEIREPAVASAVFGSRRCRSGQRVRFIEPGCGSLMQAKKVFLIELGRLAFDSGVFNDVFYAGSAANVFSSFLLKAIKLIILGKHISSYSQKFAIKMPKDRAHEFT